MRKISDNDHLNPETLITEVCEAETKYTRGIDKESHVIKKLLPKILKFSGAGWFTRFLVRKLMPIALRLGVRAVVTLLNDLLGKGWIEVLQEEREKMR